MSNDLEQLRKKMKERQGRASDPHEYKPPKAKLNEAIEVRFYILPGLSAGDKTVSGLCSRSMDGLFHVEHGRHYYNKRYYTCPRVTTGEVCPLCNLGFDQLDLIDKGDKAKRSKVAREYLASPVYRVNIYFPPSKSNPVELHNKVMFFDASKTAYNHWFDAVMRTDAGDPDDPRAYGDICDPKSAYLYQLSITEKGGFNNYEKSKFLTSRQQIAASDNETQKILDARIDLWSKVEPAELDKIEKLVAELETGTVSNDSNSGFQSDTTDSGDAPVDHTPVPEPITVRTESAVPKSTTKPKSTKTESTKTESIKTTPKSEVPVPEVSVPEESEPDITSDKSSVFSSNDNDEEDIEAILKSL